MRVRALVLLLAGLLVGGAAPLTAAGTVTITEEAHGTIKKIALVWTSDASGDVSGTLTTLAYTGAIERLVTVPAGGGSAPTDNYDVTLLDEDGVDVLMGAGANRDTAVTEQVLRTSLGVVANDRLALVVANAGATKGGTVYVYLR